MSLPPLPDQRNVALIQGFEGSEYRNLSYDYCETTAKHSINQMREYGALCAKQERDACILAVKLNTPRNGHASPENKLRDKIIAAIEARGE